LGPIHIFARHILVLPIRVGKVMKFLLNQGMKCCCWDSGLKSMRLQNIIIATTVHIHKCEANLDYHQNWVPCPHWSPVVHDFMDDSNESWKQWVMDGVKEKKKNVGRGFEHHKTLNWVNIWVNHH
jgi:hypothetical protein